MCVESDKPIRVFRGYCMNERNGKCLRRRVAALIAALLLLCGCGAQPTTPAPAGQPVRMIALTYDEGAPDTPIASHTVTYTYETDTAGRVTVRRYTLAGAEYCERTTYDAAGRTVYVTGDGPTAGSAHRYTYDAGGRCETDETYTRAGEEETLSARTAYTYGEGERAQAATITDAAGVLRCTAAFTYTPPTETDPTAAALVEEMVLAAADGTVLRTTCTVYDAADRPLYRETAGDVTSRETYTYDTDGRLLIHTARQNGQVYEERYEYV